MLVVGRLLLQDAQLVDALQETLLGHGLDCLHVLLQFLHVALQLGSPVLEPSDDLRGEDTRGFMSLSSSKKENERQRGKTPSAVTEVGDSPGHWKVLGRGRSRLDRPGTGTFGRGTASPAQRSGGW